MPIMVCEAGYDNGVAYLDQGTGADGLNYYKDSDPAIQSKLLDDLQNYYPNVVAYVTWNCIADDEDQGGIHYDAVNQSPESLSRYQVFANDPYCELFYTP